MAGRGWRAPVPPARSTPPPVQWCCCPRFAGEKEFSFGQNRGNCPSITWASPPGPGEHPLARCSSPPGVQRLLRHFCLGLNTPDGRSSQQRDARHPVTAHCLPRSSSPYARALRPVGEGRVNRGSRCCTMKGERGERGEAVCKYGPPDEGPPPFHPSHLTLLPPGRAGEQPSSVSAPAAAWEHTMWRPPCLSRPSTGPSRLVSSLSAARVSSSTTATRA
ncbi:hypothetical protein NDU88_011718 [Pleurodeles waltl]|uniref:Uncharacterized protein n=1 Tax=Pleurodeles waltl TaxID=8319 RepID=A0AAV7QY36_PLEWA|nr:hypothetical protein NDU88_011718 [Pleurodeles waltl]